MEHVVERLMEALPAASVIAGFVWLVSHDALYHPIGNTIAAFMVAVPPIVIACLVCGDDGEAGHDA